MQKLPPYLAALGFFGLVVALGLWQYGGGAARYAVSVAVVSVALLIYYLIERPEKVMRAVTGRSARYGGNALAMSLAFIGIVALLNVLSARFSYRLDLTESKDFTLSQQTIKVLTDLKQPVKLTGFYKDGQGKDEIQDVVKQFQQHSSQISFEVVDPDLKPGLARQMGVEFAGTTVVESNGNRQSVIGSSEGDLISGVLKVTRATTKKVYFVVGHGEADPENADQAGASGAKQALENESYKVESLNIVSVGKIPDDASLVIVAGPTKALLPDEAKALNDYLDNGGKALFLADPAREASLPEIADRFGISIGKGYVVDYGQSLPGEPLVPIITGRGYLPSPITRSLPTMTLLPTATEVKAKSGQSDGKYTVTPFAQTTDNSWLKNDVSSNNLAPVSGTDQKGPITVGASAITAGADQSPDANNAGKKSTRLVVIGDVDFVTNQVLNWEGNRDLLVNSVNWLAEDEDLIGVRAKQTTDRTMMLTSQQMSLVMYTSIFLLPLSVLAIGGWVVWGRRRLA